MAIKKQIQGGMTRCLLALMPVFICLLAFAQLEAGKCEFRNNEYTIEINKKVNENQLNLFIEKYDLKDLDLKTVFKTNQLDKLKNEGWKVKTNTDKVLVITKPLSGTTNLNNPSDNIAITGKGLSIAQRFPPTSNAVVYGYNRFRNKSPFAVNGLEVTFYLRNYQSARTVMLAGSFNDFSPDNLRMKKTDSGWIATVKLNPGKYWYKFITDGNWILDEDNYLHENDGLGNTNSVYYKPNTLFQLSGHTSAKKAYLVGSFNNWKKGELLMTRTATGWILPLYLSSATHTYKYLVDNVYYSETGKSEKLPDGHGGYNSVVRLGKPYVFTLAGYTHARKVVVAGTFNHWREDELFMTRTATGWQLPYTLGEGNYQYKFIVDGRWILDPANPQTGTLNGETNSYLVMGANYTFRFKEAPNARSVYLAGDFNNWAPRSLPMKKEGNEWTCSIYLSAGKHKYKFLVDDKWITDPANKNWEQNEFGTGNSVVWIEK